MTYVNGSVAPVPADHKEAYIAFARQMAELFKRNGALAVHECWEDDVPEGKVTSFPMAVQRKEGEAIAMSWIIWPDKATHDKGWEAMMADPLMDPENSTMPFDGSRMIFGSFETVLSA